MTTIGQVDRILLLLREQLQRAADDRARAPATAASAPKSERRPLDRARTLAAFDAIDPDQRRRLIIRTLLLEEFGESVGADPSFVAMVDRVLAMVRDMPGGDALIDQAIAQLNKKP